MEFWMIAGVCGLVLLAALLVAVRMDGLAKRRKVSQTSYDELRRGFEAALTGGGFNATTVDNATTSRRTVTPLINEIELNRAAGMDFLYSELSHGRRMGTRTATALLNGYCNAAYTREQVRGLLASDPRFSNGGKGWKQAPAKLAPIEFTD